jgi:hypothetical protein
VRQMKRAARGPCGCGGVEARRGAGPPREQDQRLRRHGVHACDHDFEQGKDEEEKDEKAK